MARPGKGSESASLGVNYAGFPEISPKDDEELAQLKTVMGEAMANARERGMQIAAERRGMAVEDFRETMSINSKRNGDGSPSGRDPKRIRPRGVGRRFKPQFPNSSSGAPALPDEL